MFVIGFALLRGQTLRIRFGERQGATVNGNGDNVIFAVKALQLVDNIRSFRTVNTFLAGKIFDQDVLSLLHINGIFTVALRLTNIVARCKGNGCQTQEQKNSLIFIS